MWLFVKITRSILTWQVRIYINYEIVYYSFLLLSMHFLLSSFIKNTGCVYHSTLIVVFQTNEQLCYMGNAIENWGCSFAFIYVWTYVCHFVLWPSHNFALNRCSTPFQISLKQNPLAIDQYPYRSRNWIVYRFEFFCGCS